MGQESALEGRVFVQFIVQPDGQPTDLRVVRSPDSRLNDEALRVAGTARFRPGLQRGQPVAVRYALPIQVRLPDQAAARVQRAGEGLTFSSPAPNPTRGLARIALRTETAEPVEVSVVDLLGRQLVQLHDGPLAVGEQTFEIDGAALPAGVYVVRASSASGTASQRMTVVR
ncbi:MAG: hypothetical protein Rubg2KO_14810 [Rubricoccaceae bacterium]